MPSKTVLQEKSRLCWCGDESSFAHQCILLPETRVFSGIWNSVDELILWETFLVPWKSTPSEAVFKLSPSQEVLFVVVGGFFFLKKNEQNIQPSVFSGSVICNLHMAFEKTSLLPLREWFSKENPFTVLPTLYMIHLLFKVWQPSLWGSWKQQVLLEMQPLGKTRIQ